MSARFRIHDVFELSGRGPVLAGEVLEGRVTRGMRVPFPHTGDAIVAAVEAIDNVGEGRSWTGLVLRYAPPVLVLRDLLPPATELTLDVMVPRSGGGARPGALRRFWFPLSEGLGIGVTAPTEAEARALAEAAQRRCYPTAALEGDVVPDVDISTLDVGHVVPNMGVPTLRGVWYPRLNV